MYKRFIKNTFSAIFLQFVTVVSGLILPKLILGYYGSAVNGLVSSIIRFLSFVRVVDFGTGNIIQSSFYKPLSMHDEVEVNRIFQSAKRFYHKISMFISVYVIFLAVFFPLLFKGTESYFSVSCLVLIISVQVCAEYFCGIVERFLLSADQRGHILYVFRIVSVCLNVIVCCFLIMYGTSIHVVKLADSVLLSTPLLLSSLYVRKHYKLAKKDELAEVIKRKWDGFPVHLSALVFECAPTMLLTLFADFRLVSVYIVYNMVISCVRQLLTTATNGFQALLGYYWGKGDEAKFRRVFSEFDWIIHTASIFLCGCLFTLLPSFVMLYTHGVTDVVYMRPFFSACLVVANLFYCLRLPYHVLVKSCMQYRQTGKSYYIGAILLVVVPFGFAGSSPLIGIAFGVLTSMLFHYVWLRKYFHRELLAVSYGTLGKQIFADVVVISVGIVCTWGWTMDSSGMTAWTWMAVKVAMVWLGVSTAVNLFFFRAECMYICEFIRAGKS